MNAGPLRVLATVAAMLANCDGAKAQTPVAADARSASEARSATAPRPTGLPSPAVAPVEGGTDISFGRDILPVFERTCTQADNCHGSVPAEAIDLDLRAPTAYEALAGRPAQGRRGALRVAPGDPSASFLLAKVAGPLRPGEGKPMPLDPDTGAPLRPSPITRDFVGQVLRPWIQAGAPNN
jgi:hypothetical protein